MVWHTGLVLQWYLMGWSGSVIFVVMMPVDIWNRCENNTSCDSPWIIYPLKYVPCCSRSTSALYKASNPKLSLWYLDQIIFRVHELFCAVSFSLGLFFFCILLKTSLTLTSFYVFLLISATQKTMHFKCEVWACVEGPGILFFLSKMVVGDEGADAFSHLDKHPSQQEET